MSINAVLVGGCADGRRVVLPDGTMRHDVVKCPPMKWLSAGELSPELVLYERQSYNLFRLHPVTRAVVFAYEELTPTDIMERLLEGYSPETQEQAR